MLLFAMYCLNFFNIYAIDDGFFLVFRDAWIVSFSKYNSSNSPLCHTWRSSASWWFFDLECLERFGISITALNKIPFIKESWIHSFNLLVVSSIYLFPQEPEGKREKISMSEKNFNVNYVDVWQDGILHWQSSVLDCCGSCCIIISRWYIVFVFTRSFVFFFTFSFMSIQSSFSLYV